MTQAVVLDAVRTPVGRFAGGLATVRPDDLAALVLDAAVARAGIDPADIEDVVLGCANQAGEDNRLGLVTMCIGVGQGIALVVEKADA